MSKKTKLTDVEIYYIQNNPDNLTMEALAEKLDRGICSIRKYMRAKKEAEIQTNIKPPREKTYTEQLFSRIRHKRDKNKVIGTIMTEGASSASDAERKSNKSSRYAKDAVVKIHDE